MRWFTPELKMLPGSNASNKQKVLVVALVLLPVLLPHEVRCDPPSVPSECCIQPTRACRLHLLLCRPSSVSAGPADAAAGILTLGKRTEDDRVFNSRLQQLLHESRNRAAGILTVGRRTQSLWGSPSDATPSPV
ncbi:orexin [Syngnathoides biaculeatus]|uniref:orexin n=1 Tax=Syngnathoides biaculeatus TaxID=300417 RepID=UPI002ADD4BD8|nr:orexin [Syngnathoides biaculeatus]